ncbi:hypothetical protein D9M69_731460 [compost metagenome]
MADRKTQLHSFLAQISGDYLRIEIYTLGGQTGCQCFYQARSATVDAHGKVA